MSEQAENKPSLKELALLFLKLGITGFGGPAVHISMMRNEVVLKRKWLSEEKFIDLVGAVNMIPGPNSTELAIHIGKEKAGWKGLLTAGVCFIIPAVIITAVIAWFYRQYGALPDVQKIIFGIKPAIIAIIAVNVFPLVIKAGKTKTLIFIGVLALALSLLGVNEVLIIFGAGLIMLLLKFVTSNFSKNKAGVFLPFAYTGSLFKLILQTDNLNLFLTFLKIGSILYGSGYVLFAFLEGEFVTGGILTQQQLVDAIAVGQFTPGPVFSAVTFIGWQVNGPEGALVSTAGVFIPSFIFVGLLGLIIKKLRGSNIFTSFLDAVNISSLALIFSVCITFGKEITGDWRSVFIAVLSLAVCIKYQKLNTALIVLGGSLAGYLLLLF